jgi:hypothetical protein
MSNTEIIKNDIMDLFRGLMQGSIGYSFSSLHCAMKTDIGEILDGIAGDVVMDIDMGKEVTNEQLKKLADDLLSFAEEFEVEEAKTLAEKIRRTIQG